jgi:energy-coupling factor transport system permease protein
MYQNKSAMLGQYRPADSAWHRLDARVKIFLVSLVLVLALLTSSYVFYLVLLAALLISLFQARVTPMTLYRNFKPLLVIVLITFLYHIVFSGAGTDVVTTVFGLDITTEALSRAGYFSLRLIIFITVAYLVTLTSSPSELAEALIKLLKPLRKIGVPVYDLGLILFIAIRFIPVLYEEFAAIKNAQIIRGVNFGGSVFKRIKKTVYILIPVFVAAIGRADDLALAIEARGYDGRAERSFYTRTTFAGREWLFTTVGTLFIVSLFIVTL